MSSICSVLLAAGNSSRFDGIKLLAKIDGIPMIRRAAQAALDAGTELLIVTGAHVAPLEAELDGLAAPRVHNADWEQGMGTSIACAFRYLAALEHPPDAALISLADQPLVQARQLRRVIDAHHAAPDCIIAASYGDTVGPPCLFPRRFFAELSRLSGAPGARRILQAHAQELTTVPMPEASVDIDTQDDYLRVVEMHSAPQPDGTTPSSAPSS